MMGVVYSAGQSLDTCVDHEGSSKEFTTADFPQFIGVAEHALGSIEAAAMAGAPKFPGAQLPVTAPLCAEASHWACDVLRKTATTSITQRTSHRMRCGMVDPPW